MTFLQHLEALRWHLVRSAAVVMLLAFVLFCYKDFVFSTIIFGPMHSDFLTYRALCKISHLTGMGNTLCMQSISFELINIDLSGQFTTHIWTSVIGGVVVGSPYVLWEVWRFIRPALHEKEKKYTAGVVLYASLLFITGILFSYYIIVPMTINFLGNYQVSALVTNKISMDSYISTVTILTLIMGLVFELPILIFFLTKIGLLGPAFMRKYRKHAIVVILIVAAIITPTSDIPTLVIVSTPLYLLYEASIFVAKYAEKKA
ncbi:MAG: twin-arginine translocase subunit TatC [Bacteroidetes bacterium]|nr:twin-arginine translocase subunit TatC [Bacteroidota bacterium]